MKRFAALALILCLSAAAAITWPELTAARDRQDLPAIERLIKQSQDSLQQHPDSPEANYKLALAYSYAAEVALELHNKPRSASYAEAGLEPARKAANAPKADAEYHRLFGEICGQVIPVDPLMGMLKYGQCARDEIDKAISIDNKLALAYVSRGVGNYYLPSGMGGGLDLALKDLDKAISLDPNLAEAFLWKGIVLRKAHRDPEARQAFGRAIQLDPNRLWAKEQFSKTPVQ